MRSGTFRRSMSGRRSNCWIPSGTSSRRSASTVPSWKCYWPTTKSNWSSSSQSTMMRQNSGRSLPSTTEKKTSTSLNSPIHKGSSSSKIKRIKRKLSSRILKVYAETKVESLKATTTTLPHETSSRKAVKDSPCPLPVRFPRPSKASRCHLLSEMPGSKISTSEISKSPNTPPRTTLTMKSTKNMTTKVWTVWLPWVRCWSKTRPRIKCLKMHSWRP